jgi:hypothetical protein
MSEHGIYNYSGARSNGFAPNVIGLKPEQVALTYNRLINDIDATLADWNKSISLDLCDIENSWACPEAVNFCKDMVNDFNNLYNELVKSYQDILNAIQKASLEWSVTTQANCRLHDYTIERHGDFVSDARAEINGIVGIDVQNMRECIGGWKRNINVDNSRGFNCVANDVKDIGLLGKGQEAALISASRDIEKRMYLRWYTLCDELSDLLDKIVTKYEDTAGRVSEAFSSLAY